MTKFKSTKRALLASGMALVLCVSMLVGSTFAWFTDSVTTAGNTIQSGTLQVDLVDESGASLENKVLAFEDKDGNNLWEPGCTYNTQKFFVKNNGNLALQYQIAINGLNGNAKLLEAIEWTITVGGVKKDIADLKGTLLNANDQSAAIVLSGHMKEEAGNEYQGLTVEGISVSVFATQYTHESDSKDNQYDKLATIDNIEELKAALAKKNVKIVLGSNITLNEGIAIAADQNVTIDLSGHTMSQSATQTAAYAMITNKGTLTINDRVGTGKLSFEDVTVYTKDPGWASNTIRNEGVLNIEGGTIENTSEGSVYDYGYPHAIDVYQGSVTNISGGTVKSVNYDSIRMFCNSNTLPTEVNISGGTIYNRVTFQNPNNNTHVTGYGRLNITGGNFVTTDNINANVRLLQFAKDASNMKATVTGGTFDKGIGISNYSGADVVDDWMTVTGGTFGADPSAYVAEGYAITTQYAENGDIFYIVGKKTSTDNNAEKVVVNEDAKVDIKDDSIQGTVTNNGGELTITNSTVHNVANHSYSAALGEGSYTEFVNTTITNATGGGITLKNGEAVFESGIINIQNTKSRHMFYVGTDTGFAKLTIKDGTFNLKNKTTTSSYLVAQNEGAVIIIEGGNFEAASTKKAPVQELAGGEVIIKGGTFKWDPSSWVAEGYQAVENNGSWTVSAK